MNEYEENYSTLNQAYEKITTEGFCVIKNVINKNEVTEAQNGLWNTLNYLTKNFDKPIKYDDKDSWKTYYEFQIKHVKTTLAKKCRAKVTEIQIQCVGA